MTCPKARCWILGKILSATLSLFYDRERGCLRHLLLYKLWSDPTRAEGPCYCNLSSRLAYGTQPHYIAVFMEVTEMRTQLSGEPVLPLG